MEGKGRVKLKIMRGVYMPQDNPEPDAAPAVVAVAVIVLLVISGILMLVMD